MFHAALITVHTVTGTIALAAGLGFLFRAAAWRLHRWTVVIMTATLLGALVVGWSQRDAAQQVVFWALGALAVAMSVASLRVSPPGNAAQQVAIFNVISLTTGLLAIAGLRLGGPVASAVCGALTVLVVRWLLLHFRPVADRIDQRHDEPALQPAGR
ncbi:MAG: hypothetical protein Q4G51_14265 [Dermatophilus congolensis]|nr:hypothetical protein [Dermatophilus congolensis]